MEQRVTARLDAIGSDGLEVALSRAAPGDDPLTTFQPEPQQVGEGSGHSVALRMDAIPSQAPPVPFATPSVNDGKPRTAGVVNRIKRVLQTLDVAGDFEKTVDNRLAALRGLDQEVQDRAWRLECLNQEMIVGAARADDILQAIGLFEQTLADLRWHKQDLREIETTLADFENRSQTVSTSLGSHLAGWEAREAAVVDAVEQLGRRAADTIDGLEGRVGDCEARAHIAEQTITRLDDVSSRTLPAVGQCDQDLARIELAVPQLARQLEDLSASAEQQSLVLAVHQQRVRQTLDESQKAAGVVSELEGRIVDLSGSDQQLDRLEKCVAQLEQRATAAVGASTHAAHASKDLEQKIAVLQTQLQSMAETAQDGATKLVDLQRQAERHQLEHAQRTTAVVSGLEARLASGHQLLNRVEAQMRELEQRTTSAATELKHVTDVRADLAARQEAERYRREETHSASSPSAHDLLNTLRFRFRMPVPNTSRGFSPTRLVFGGAAFALSAAMVLLVSIAWRISPVENQGPKRPLSAVVLASRALAPALVVAQSVPLTADISHDRPEATRPAPAVPAVRVPLVVVSKTPVATRGVPTAAVREQSVGKGARTPLFVGTLLIESDPAGAAVFVNQESVGDTPVLLKDMRTGSYVVRLESEGYQRWSSAATVSAVRQERVKAKLERER
jgi:hypothetical protein